VDLVDQDAVEVALSEARHRSSQPRANMASAWVATRRAWRVAGGRGDVQRQGCHSRHSPLVNSSVTSRSS
jgi:hypothetical protein